MRLAASHTVKVEVIPILEDGVEKYGSSSRGQVNKSTRVTYESHTLLSTWFIQIAQFRRDLSFACPQTSP